MGYSSSSGDGEKIKLITNKTPFQNQIWKGFFMGLNLQLFLEK
jgi:hypothetical protein